MNSSPHRNWASRLAQASFIFGVLSLVAALPAFVSLFLALASTESVTANPQTLFPLLPGLFIPPIALACGIAANIIASRLPSDQPFPRQRQARFGVGVGVVWLVLVLWWFSPPCQQSIKTSQATRCNNNLRQIDGAKDQYALEYGATNGEILSWDNIGLYVKDITNSFYCPAAKGSNRTCEASYEITPLGTDPRCKLYPATHSLSWKIH